MQPKGSQESTLNPVLIKMYLFHNLTSCFVRIQFYIVLPSASRHPECFLLSGFPAKILYAFLIFPMRAACPTQYHSHLFGEE
jgi:hypothetical protein